MNRILASTTAALLLLHTLLGCCWLHARGCDDAVASGHVATGHVAICCEECCNDHAGLGAEHSQNSGGPCDCRIECHGVCIYLPPEKARIDSQPTVIGFALVADAAALDSDLAAGTTSNPSGGPLDTVVPLRLHLLHQILLI